MQRDTGEIRPYKDIPQQENDEGLWSEPFAVGDVVTVKGVQMQIVKIKRSKQMLILQHFNKKRGEVIEGCPPIDKI